MYYDIAGMNTRILGSLHMLPAHVEEPPSWVADAFDWSESIEMEHDSNDLDRCGFDPASRDLKPWARLLNMIRVITSQLPAQQGVEARFAEALQAAGRPPMRYIETAASFAELLDAVPAYDLALAEMALDAARPSMLSDFARLHSAWDRADDVGLRSVQETGPLHVLATLRQAFFLSRNENWAQTIATRQAPEQPHLIVVGALHLVGTGSLLDRLAARGLAVSRLIE